MMNSGPLDRKILSILDTKGNVDTLELASEWKIDHQVVVGEVLDNVKFLFSFVALAIWL